MNKANGSAGLRLSLCLLAPLQDVLRSWYARLPAVVHNAHSLVQQTEKCAEAFRQGELVFQWRAGGERDLALCEHRELGRTGPYVCATWFFLLATMLVGSWTLVCSPVQEALLLLFPASNEAGLPLTPALPFTLIKRH